MLKETGDNEKERLEPKNKEQVQREIFIHWHNPIYNLRTEENVIDDSFGRGYVRYGFGGSLKVIYLLLVDVGVLVVWEAGLQ